MLKVIKSYIPSPIKKILVRFRNIVNDPYVTKSYSQEGEDMILRRLFGDQKIGFYVDVGAHHPFRFSNTYMFYKKGWSGINIDAMPSSMNIFRKFRARDINLELPISEKSEILTYYAFNEPALNGFSKELSNSRLRSHDCKIIFQQDMETKTLAQVLDIYLPVGEKIKFLSIDVEGLDFAVLRSNNWEKYRPEVVLVEILASRLEEIITSDISIFMKRYGYSVFAKTFNTVFFKLDLNL